MPIASGPYNYGIATAPAGGAVLTSISWTGNKNGVQGNLIPGQFYKVVCRIFVDGTTTGADDDNMQFHGLGGPGVSGANSPQAVCPANGQVQEYQFIVQAPIAGGSGVFATISIVAAGGAAAVYHGYMMFSAIDLQSDDVTED